MLKIGVLGAGHLGRIHIKLLKEISDYELVGFYDPSDDNANRTIEELKVKRFDSLDKLIDNVDVVDIVTPTISHYECAVNALKKFRHIFIEKPLTNTIEEAKKLIDIVREAGVKMQVGHVERFNPAYIAVKSYINSPMFVETHRLAMFNPRGTDVSVVLDLMIHDLDIILSIVNSNIKKIHASGVAVVSDTPDIANARIEFDNGCVANLTASRISMKNMRKTRFFQKDAYISVDFLEKKSEVLKLKSITEVNDPLALVIDLGKDKGKKQIYYETPKTPEINSIKEELKSFADSINNNTKPIVTITDGYNALSVAYKIIEKINVTNKFC